MKVFLPTWNWIKNRQKENINPVIIACEGFIVFVIDCIKISFSPSPLMASELLINLIRLQVSKNILLIKQINKETRWLILKSWKINSYEFIKFGGTYVHGTSPISIQSPSLSTYVVTYSFSINFFSFNTLSVILIDMLWRSYFNRK